MTLGAVTVDEPATLFFRCTLGDAATIRYGSGSQPCPAEGALLGIDLAETSTGLALSVTGPPGTEWVVSVGRNSTR